MGAVVVAAAVARMTTTACRRHVVFYTSCYTDSARGTWCQLCCVEYWAQSDKGEARTFCSVRQEKVCDVVLGLWVNAAKRAEQQASQNQGCSIPCQNDDTILLCRGGASSHWPWRHIGRWANRVCIGHGATSAAGPIGFALAMSPHRPLGQ
jgi:hypothetical protein